MCDPRHHPGAGLRPAGHRVRGLETQLAGTCAPGESDKSKPAIFVIGDSFTEGLGVPYEETFAGLMACDAAKEGKAVWNLGVLSFSPVIYYRKTRVAAERLGIKPTEIYVFLDMSDITDEAIVYRESEDGTITMAPSFDWFDTGQFLLGNFATFRLLYNLWLDMPFGSAAPDESWRARWSLDPKIMDEWGRRGLELAGKNLDKIVEICREWKCQLTLVTTNSNPDRYAQLDWRSPPSTCR